MKSRFESFNCNICSKHLCILIYTPENDDEYDHLKNALKSPFAENIKGEITKVFPCEDKNCSGRINAVLVDKKS